MLRGGSDKESACSLHVKRVNYEYSRIGVVMSLLQSHVSPAQTGLDPRTFRTALHPAFFEPHDES